MFWLLLIRLFVFQYKSFDLVVDDELHRVSSLGPPGVNSGANYEQQFKKIDFVEEHELG